MGNRRKAREFALQVLFHLEFSKNDPSRDFELICNTFGSRKSTHPFARRLVEGVCESKEDLDELIRNASQHWRLERMSRLDRCILRLATLELLFFEDVPPKVSIDEALEIAKKYGSEDSSRFINGVLDNVYNTLMQQGRLKKEVGDQE